MELITKELEIENAALQKAKTIFRIYRDDHDKVYNRNDIVAACIILGDEFYQKEHLVQLESKDEGFMGSFCCSLCDAKFMRELDLQIHEETCPYKKKVAEPPRKKQRLNLKRFGKEEDEDEGDL